MQKRWLAGAAFAALETLAPFAHAEGMTFEGGVDTAYMNDGLTGLNERFSPNAGAFLGVSAPLSEHLSIEAWGRKSFAGHELPDAEIDLGLAVSDVKLGDSGVSVDAYVGRWQYGESLSVGDMAARIEVSFADAHASVTRLDGISDTMVYGLSYDFTAGKLTLSPSMSYVEATGETNYGLSASYRAADNWRIDAAMVWQEDTSPAAGVRLAYTF